jgi:hypothetical protein
MPSLPKLMSGLAFVNRKQEIIEESYDKIYRKPGYPWCTAH